ncbi:hypothetical protein D6D13_10183 [Aureobasidium pullulans]|uniref:Peroxin/Ferlin domain-containing protein n=1 Tax=Aureobasidium pullulans TaxID=5580 RepID=A0A4S9BZ23_AURPU|nr:hypothetical protein D6D13_10183 [Aureobasidium pullulans]
MSQQEPSSALTSRDSSATLPGATTPQLPSRRHTAQQITLVDRTNPDHPEIQNPGEVQYDDDITPENASLSRRWTKQSLQGHAHSLQGSVQNRMTSRKYRNYREGRFIGPEDPDNPCSADELSSSTTTPGKVARGKNRVRGLLGAKKQMKLALEEDAVIDVLYENQRGWWFFGIPHFSSKTLLNFDPKPWLNGHKKTSPVNITNAQVPDPSWEWAWKSWYVDMSRDVDEEGWEYSFWFSDGTAWHGTHPWGYSWVRRRRWLRKRVRKQPQQGAQQGHAFTSEYFTIHRPKAESRSSSFVFDSVARQNLATAEHYLEDPEDVRDIGSLLNSLKRAAIDREKIVLVRHFIDNGGDDLHYLGEQMETIMALCIFQNSRRYILTMLSEKLTAAEKSRDEHTAHDEEVSAQEQQTITNLEAAVEAADEQVKRLEYWSDVRDMARSGITSFATDEDKWGYSRWRGLDSSGPEADSQSTAKEKGKTWKQVKKEVDTQLKPKDSKIDAPNGDKKELRVGERLVESSEEGNYTTAAEDVGPKDKGKQRAE